MSEYVPSDEDIEFCQQAEVSDTAYRLLIGDLINRRADQHGAAVLHVARRLAREAGGSTDRYRDYARIAAAITPDLREEFHTLTITQFRACMSGDDLRTTLEWAALEYPEQHNGRPATEQAIYERTLGARSDSKNVEYRYFHSIQRRMERAAADDRLRPALREIAVRFLWEWNRAYEEE